MAMMMPGQAHRLKISNVSGGSSQSHKVLAKFDRSASSDGFTISWDLKELYA